jgi:ABC-2 type transport system permease protein
MRRIVLLMTAIFRIALQRALAHRANLLFELFMALFGTVAAAVTLRVVFEYTSSLAGWTLGESMLLLGCYMLMSGIVEAWIQPNLDWFAGKVTSGELDDLLLQPVSSLFLVSFNTVQPLALLQSILGACVIAWGLFELGAAISLAGVLGCLLLLSAGLMIAWATRFLMACSAFWAPALEPSVLYNALWQLGRYPVSIYHPAIAGLLTYVVPVACIATFPAMSLARGPDPIILIASCLTAIVFVCLAVWTWQRGLAQYRSATS